MSPAEKLQSAGFTLVVPVAEGMEVASHQVNLKVGTQDQQICKVDSAGPASCSGNCMVMWTAITL